MYYENVFVLNVDVRTLSCMMMELVSVRDVAIHGENKSERR